MATPSAAPSPRLPLIAPSEADWRAMTPAARDRFLIKVLDTLSDPLEAMTEGRRHKKAKTQALDALGLHFSTIGRSMYLAEEMAVLYPGEPVFSPDLLAVADVIEPDDDPRMAWVVADEGKGIDLVIEVLHRGDRNKDLVFNVERYAGLGIPEYFVYDRMKQQIVGYRLPDGRARRYQRIVPQFGHHASGVLGLDLAIVGGKLRFFSGQAELPRTTELLGRLNGMVTALETKADAAQAQIDAAQAQADAAQAEAEEAHTALRQGITALLAARAIPLPADLEEQLNACAEASTLQRWLLRAMKATSAEEVFSQEP